LSTEPRIRIGRDAQKYAANDAVARAFMLGHGARTMGATATKDTRTAAKRATQVLGSIALGRTTTTPKTKELATKVMSSLDAHANDSASSARFWVGGSKQIDYVEFLRMCLGDFCQFLLQGADAPLAEAMLACLTDRDIVMTSAWTDPQALSTSTLEAGKCFSMLTLLGDPSKYDATDATRQFCEKVQGALALLQNAQLDGRVAVPIPFIEGSDQETLLTLASLWLRAEVLANAKAGGSRKVEFGQLQDDLTSMLQDGNGKEGIGRAIATRAVNALGAYKRSGVGATFDDAYRASVQSTLMPPPPRRSFSSLVARSTKAPEYIGDELPVQDVPGTALVVLCISLYGIRRLLRAGLPNFHEAAIHTSRFMQQLEKQVWPHVEDGARTFAVQCIVDVLRMCERELHDGLATIERKKIDTCIDAATGLKARLLPTDTPRGQRFGRPYV
jgi:hypothetical protein